MELQFLDHNQHRLLYAFLLVVCLDYHIVCSYLFHRYICYTYSHNRLKRLFLVRTKYLYLSLKLLASIFLFIKCIQFNFSRFLFLKFTSMNSFFLQKISFIISIDFSSKAKLSWMPSIISSFVELLCCGSTSSFST